MSLTKKASKVVSSNWISISLTMIVVLGLTITVIGQFGLDLALGDPNNQSIAMSNSQTSQKSLETIEIANTGTIAQTIKDQYTRNEKIQANGLEVKVLDFNKFIYTSSINQSQDVYCAIGLEITNISDSDIKILPDFDFDLVDGSPSGGILLTPPLIKSIDSKPDLEIVEFTTVKLVPNQIFSKSIPFACQENPEYQLLIKTTQFQSRPLFKAINIKLV